MFTGAVIHEANLHDLKGNGVGNAVSAKQRAKPTGACGYYDELCDVLDDAFMVDMIVFIWKCRACEWI